MWDFALLIRVTLGPRRFNVLRAIETAETGKDVIWMKFGRK